MASRLALRADVGVPAPVPTREHAIRALAICWAGGFGDYGWELVTHFRDIGLLTTGEAASLHTASAWRGYPGEHRIGTMAMRILPQSLRAWLADVSGRSSGQASLWSSVARRFVRRR